MGVHAHMRTVETLARGIAKCRTRAGLTQAALAEAINSSPFYVSQVERGQRVPSLDLVDDITDALGVTAAELFKAGEEGAAEAVKAPADERVMTLLRAWPESEREELISVLVALRKVAAGAAPAPKQRRRP